VRKLFACLGIFALVLSGCTQISGYTPGKSNLPQYKHVFVETALNDNNHLDQIMVNELKKLGYEASCGPRTMMPGDAQIKILYDGHYTWDFRIYLIQLDVLVRNASSEQLLANESLFHPGVTRKTPEAMVHELFAKVFGRYRGEAAGEKLKS
jgi:hypothetical protein